MKKIDFFKCWSTQFLARIIKFVVSEERTEQQKLVKCNKTFVYIVIYNSVSVSSRFTVEHRSLLRVSDIQVMRALCYALKI